MPAMSSSASGPPSGCRSPAPGSTHRTTRHLVADPPGEPTAGTTTLRSPPMKISRQLAMIAAMTATAALAVTGCTQRNSEDPSGDGSAGGDGGGGDVTVAFVPKLQGIPYFEAMNTGGEQAAEELGFEWLYQGPTEADA